MAAHHRLACAACFCLGLLALPSASAETLREYLMAREIDPEGVSGPNLDRAITSGDCLDEEGLFLTAYYLEHASGGLVGPIQVEMLDKKRRIWTHKEVEKGWDTCPGGGILNIRRTKTGFCWYGHINPSAGVTFILSPTLELLGCVLGSYRGDFADGTIVYANSLPHFAPTHPGTLSLYNPNDKSDRKIYPMKPWQAVREGHIAKVRAAYDRLGQEWLREHNHHGDPDQFTSIIGDAVATNDATDSLAFIALFDNSETLDEAAPRHTKVVYIYRNMHTEGRIEYREILHDEVKSRFGDISLQELLEPKMLEVLFGDPS